jgi:hypothetical protein
MPGNVGIGIDHFTRCDLRECPSEPTVTEDSPRGG